MGDLAGDDGGASWEGSTKTGVELWDVSGATEYENCWPAIQKDADAVIVAFNPDNPLHERSSTRTVGQRSRKTPMPSLWLLIRIILCMSDRVRELLASDPERRRCRHCGF